MIVDNTAQLSTAIAADFNPVRGWRPTPRSRRSSFQKSELKGWMEPVEKLIPRFLVESVTRATCTASRAESPP
jgi:hypothetical protein